MSAEVEYPNGQVLQPGAGLSRRCRRHLEQNDDTQVQIRGIVLSWHCDAAPVAGMQLLGILKAAVGGGSSQFHDIPMLLMPLRETRLCKIQQSRADSSGIRS